MKQVIFLIEHTWQGTTFRPADGNTTITSDLAIAWAALGIVQILGDGCGCGEKIEIAPGTMMAPVTNNPNRPFLPEDMEEEVAASVMMEPVTNNPNRPYLPEDYDDVQTLHATSPPKHARKN